MAASASAEELARKVDKFADVFAELGKQLRELQEALQKNVRDLKEIEKGQNSHNDRIKKLEAQRQMDLSRMSYMEDQLRRNNLRLRGFKKDFADGREIMQKTCQWMNDNSIDIGPDDIERVHWTTGIRKEGALKDIIIKFTSSKKAEEVYKGLRKTTDLNFKQSPIRVLRDFSSLTLQERKKMKPIADLLYQNNINFTWQYPATITIFRDGRSLRARSLEEGKELLSKFGIEMVASERREATSSLQEMGAVGGTKEQETDSQALLRTDETLRMRELEEELSILKSKRLEKADEGRVTRQQKKK